IAGITFARPHVGMEMEQLSQSDDRRKIIQSFAFKVRAQFFLCFVLWLTGDGSEQRAGSVLKRLYSAIRKCVAFFTPKFPSDVAGHVFGIKFHSIENEPSRLHHIVSHAVPWHPRNSVFGHK